MSEASLIAAMDAWSAATDADAVYPLKFTPTELADAAAQKILTRREHTDGVDRVVGLTWTPASRDALWIAIQDDRHFHLVSGLIDEELPTSTRTDKLLYQRLDLPWPFADRQWVIEVKNNDALAAATGGGLWERSWALTSLRGATQESADAVWVSVNDGGWLLADVDGGTLLGYHVRSVVDGNIPNELVTQWCQSTMRGLLQGIVDRTAEVPTHYDASHPPMLRPDGTPIPPFADL